jgi:quinol monooxygenase YgiN
MLVVTRFTVSDDGTEFERRLCDAVAALAARPGYLSSRWGRAVDDPAAWVLVTEWENVGSYRRALSAYDVKLSAVPLLSLAHDEPSAFELLGSDGEGARSPASSDRADG